jgi:4-diphosphocytidyl-2-C-methyl-D-erythritol kinase
MKITVNAAAKLNLFLDILRRLDNGYHSLFMIMQSVNLYDTVEVSVTLSGKTAVSCSDPSLPSDERNIAFKAAEVFFSRAGIENPGVKIDITKRIPHAAGLAGGSADAAAVLYALNRLFDCRLSETELLNAGATVGADVPFCLVGGTCLAQNTGDVLSVLPSAPDVRFVLAKPLCSVSTKEAYEAFDECGKISHPDCTGALFCAARGDFHGLLGLAGNVFEQVVEVPDRVRIKTVMRQKGCSCCQMSGSGPTVFGVFDSEKKAAGCAEELKSFIGEVFVCSPVKSGLTEL